MPTSTRAAVLGTVSANGYMFTNFDPSLSGTAVGSNANGISNTGQAVGTSVDMNNASTFANYTGTATSLTPLNTGAGQIAFGINSAGDVVGGNGTTAFFLPHGGTVQTLTVPAGGVTNAFGINDGGAIVGQFSAGAATPGFVLPSSASGSFTAINAPSGPNTVNAQGINNNRRVVGFYVGSDGQDHGFQIDIGGVVGGNLTGVAIADPVIPSVPGEPGATFVFSQVLGINDQGLAVGYYGDSTTSQHGFVYDTLTGQYTFLDDPSEGFNGGGVEVTQITGINNTDEIAGFYTDANGIAHSFTACPTGVVCPGSTRVPEPASLVLLGVGLAGLAFARREGPAD